MPPSWLPALTQRAWWNHDVIMSTPTIPHIHAVLLLRTHAQVILQSSQPHASSYNTSTKRPAFERPDKKQEKASSPLSQPSEWGPLLVRAFVPICRALF